MNPPSTIDERAVLDQALRGDRAATETLVRHLEPVLRRQAVGVLRAFGIGRKGDLRAEADELVQYLWSILLAQDRRVLRRWDPERANLRTYVGRVARLKALSRVEARKHAPWTEGSVSIDDLVGAASTERSAEARLADAQLVHRMVETLQQELSAKARVFVDLIVVRQLSNAEIRELTGRSDGTINNLRSRFRKRLREIRDEVS